MTWDDFDLDIFVNYKHNSPSLTTHLLEKEGLVYCGDRGPAKFINTKKFSAARFEIQNHSVHRIT